MKYLCSGIIKLHNLEYLTLILNNNLLDEEQLIHLTDIFYKLHNLLYLNLDLHQNKIGKFGDYEHTLEYLSEGLS